METLTLCELLVGALLFGFVCSLVLRMEILVCQSAIRLVIIHLLTQATHCFGVNIQDPTHKQLRLHPLRGNMTLGEKDTRKQQAPHVLYSLVITELIPSLFIVYIPVNNSSPVQNREEIMIVVFSAQLSISKRK